MIVRDACPACGSTRFKKNGHTHNGKQNHQCKICPGQFVQCSEQYLISDDRGRSRLAPLDLPACPCHAGCRCPSPQRGVRSGCCPLRCGRTGGAFPEGCNPLQVHAPCYVLVKHAFLGTHLRLSMPFKEMLLTRHSVVPG